MRLLGVGIELVLCCAVCVCVWYVGIVVGFACATRSILNSKYVNTLHSLRTPVCQRLMKTAYCFMVDTIEIHSICLYNLQKSNPNSTITCY